MTEDRGANAARRVVVTGMGAVSGYGRGADRLWAGLLSGAACFDRVDRFDPSAYRTLIAAQVPDVGARGRGHERRLTLADRFALAAAQEALAQAGLSPAPGDRTVGCFFGSSTGGFWESESYYARLIGALPGRARTADLCAQQYNGPGDAVARWCGARGPVATVSSACTSGALAIGRALDAVRTGEVDLALAGGSDSLCRLTYAGFNALRAVDGRPCRPFRSDRAGLSLGEGAAVLVLEAEGEALARGHAPLARVRGFGSTCDAHHMTAPAPDGSGAATAIRDALHDGRSEAESVDFVNLHGTGTPLNDLAEWAALEAALGKRARTIPVTATKASIGHLLGSAGAIEAVATILCLMARRLPPAPGGGDVDPRAPADLVLDEVRFVPAARLALSTNLAFGGSNAALLLERCGDEP